MDAAATDNMTEATNYTMTVSSLPTPAMAMSADLSEMVVSVGKSAVTGGAGMAHSSGSLYNGVWPSYSVKAGMSLLSTNAMTYTVNRGTYSMTKVKLSPTDAAGTAQRFTEDVSVAIASAGNVVQMEPATLSAGLGDEMMWGMLGAASTS